MPKLYTEKLVGGEKACIGFVCDNITKCFVPNTLLKTDIRSLTYTVSRLVAVLRKNEADDHYNEVTYIAKNIKLADLRLPPQFDYLKAYNSSIDSDALEYLTASSSRSLGILANELEKALTYTGKKRLSLEDIKQITTPTAEDSSYLLLGCLVERKSSEAIRALRNLIYYGSNEYQLLAFLQGQYTKMLLAKDYAKRSLSKQEMKKLLKINYDFAIEALLRQSRAYQEKQLIQILAMLLDCEMDFKTMSNVGERMERLLVEMCSALEN